MFAMVSFHLIFLIFEYIACFFANLLFSLFDTFSMLVFMVFLPLSICLFWFPGSPWFFTITSFSHHQSFVVILSFVFQMPFICGYYILTFFDACVFNVKLNAIEKEETVEICHTQQQRRRWTASII